MVLADARSVSLLPDSFAVFTGTVHFNILICSLIVDQPNCFALTTNGETSCRWVANTLCIQTRILLAHATTRERTQVNALIAFF